jgi:phospholipid-binding lipoprotein MlaA
MSMTGLPLRFFASLAIAAGLSACVTLPPNAPRSPHDPLERWNRGVYKFNDALDRGVLKPVAKTYVKVLPHPVRTGVRNFFSNLDTPTVMINDLLQAKPLAALNDLGRFLMNTTIGLGGLLDPATHAGLAKNDEDFGQTLGRWGVHAGPFIELPFLGPSDLRDAPSRFVDTYTGGQYWAFRKSSVYLKYGLWGLNFVDKRAGLLSLDDAMTNAFDPYVLVRDAYLQHRAYLVSDGKLPLDSSSDDTDPDADLPDTPDKPAPKDPPAH